MNNYSNMNYFMPNDYDYYLKNMPVENQFVYDKIMPQQNNLSNNIQKDQKLAQKLSSQAGDNMNFNVSNYKQNPNLNNMYDVYNGFIRGNMFKDLYNTYKISRPYDINPLNEQAEMLTYIDAYCFAAHDLNLYLDTHPDDKEMIKLFQDYTNEANNIIKEYESKYGPLFVDSSTYPWTWNDSPWPWEKD